MGEDLQARPFPRLRIPKSHSAMGGIRKNRRRDHCCNVATAPMPLCFLVAPAVVAAGLSPAHFT
jgi:hypothetical protein